MLAIAFSTLIVAAVVAGVWRVTRTLMREHSWLPPNLARGELLFTEAQFYGNRELPIVARVDRAYLVDDVVHLVELKTRRRVQVFDSDIIELSAQRVAVQIATGRTVSQIGTVVIEQVPSRKRITRPVRLLDTPAVAELVKRRLLLLEGRAHPLETTYPGRCKFCEYRRECKGKSSARVYPMVRTPYS